MKKIFFLLFGMVFLSLACTNRGPVAKAQTALDFQLPDLNGQQVSLSDYKDKQLVILFFWTTWCTFCRKELKVLNDMRAELAENKIEILAINIDEPKEKVARFIESRSIAYKVLLDEYGDTASAYGVLGIPTYIFIDKKSQVRFRDNAFPKTRYKEFFSE